MRNLEDKISKHKSVLDMLKNAPSGFYPFPVPAEHTNWRLEQLAWEQSAVLFDQSYHMTDLYLSGPDKIRILSDVSINNFSEFESLNALQIVVCSDSGYIVGDAVAFHLQDGSVSVVGKPSCANFIEYFAQSGGYDVTMRKDIRLVDGNGRRESYRFQLLGPTACEILKKVSDTPIPDMRFFGMYELRIAKRRVTALRHGMAKAPGVEIWGPYPERDAILDALLGAGEEFGLYRGGARVYSTAGPESGWVGAVLPAIYSGTEMAAYRSCLAATSYEATLSVGGSLDSDRIEDYYFDPWDLGYHRFIHWDHEFKGRDALGSRRDGPHRKKIWLQWDPEDVVRIYRSMLEAGTPCKYLEMPAGHYASCPLDKVVIGSRQVGLSVYAAYTMGAGGWFSIGIVNAADVELGGVVEIIWGEPDGGTAKPTVEPHRQTTIRAKMASTPSRRA